MNRQGVGDGRNDRGDDRDQDDDVERLLDDLGGRARDEMLAEAEQLVGHPAEEGSRRAFERLAAPASPRLQFVGLAAAAVLLVAATAWLSRPVDVGPAPSEPYFIGRGGVEIVRPVGPGSTYDGFEWRAELPFGAVFELMIHDGAADLGAAPVLVVRELEVTTWEPTDDQRRQLPESLRWEVRRISSTGEVEGSAEAVCSRSP